MRRTFHIMAAREADAALERYLQSRAVGRRMRWMREAAGVTRAELAAYVGTSRRTIGRVEAGERILLPVERAAIARALGTSIATLAIGGNGNGNGRSA